MRIYNLSKRVRDDVGKEVEAICPNLGLKLKNLRIAELDYQDLAIVFETEEKLYLGRMKGTLYFPLLKDGILLPKLPSATVDMGAVKFVINGANVMRPGIVSFAGDFKKGNLLVIREISHQKALAVGRSMEGITTLEVMKKGVAVENLHYVGDKFWEALKSI